MKVVMPAEHDGPKPPKNDVRKTIGEATMEMEIVTLRDLYARSPHPLRTVIGYKLNIIERIRKYRNKSGSGE